MRSRTLAGAVVLLLGGLAGCSSEADDPGPSTDPASSAAPTTAPTPTTSTAPSEPSEPATPTPTPATGQQLAATYLREPVLRYRLPADREWEVRLGGMYAFTQLEDADRIEVGGRAFQTVEGEGLAFYAENTRTSTAGLDLERTTTRVVDGIEGYVLEATSRTGYAYYFGAVNGDRNAEIYFQLPKDGAAAREIIDSVLASAEWVR